MPGAVLFVFVAALGADRHRVALTLALVAAGFLAAALLRMRFAQTPRTVLGRARSPLSITLPAAAVAGTVVVLGAWVIGPRLPGADAEALVDTHNDRGGVTEVVSPLVDIRSRLVNRAATELFVVTADVSVVLAGQRAAGVRRPHVGPAGPVAGAACRVPCPPPHRARRRTPRRSSSAPCRASSCPAPPSRWRHQGKGCAGTPRRRRSCASTATSTRATASRSSRRCRTSPARRCGPQRRRPRPTRSTRALPEDFPSSVSETLRRRSRPARRRRTTPCWLLQNWFQSQFEYSLDVPGGHGNDAIEAFLRQRVGYCEQFAGTFAAMARSIGVPARVAVGFTPGHGAARRHPRRVRQERPRLAGGVVRRARLGAVRADAGPRRTRSRGLHRAARRPGRLDPATRPGYGRRGPGDGGHGAAGRGDPRATAGSRGPRRGRGPAGAVSDPQVRRPRHPLGRRRRWCCSSRRPCWRSPSWCAAGVAVTRARTSPARSPSCGSGRWGRSRPPGFRLDPTLTPLEQARAAAPRLPVAARPLKSLAEVATAATYAPPDEVAELVQPMIAGEPGPRRWCRQVERVAADSMTAGGRLRRYFTVWS